ncbi:MAG: major facilitator transporter [Clostridiales bacterium]|jgi:ACDE family multidrug resistance protein|nr:major facilitator transporter [Clostridiales bacterium]
MKKQMILPFIVLSTVPFIMVLGNSMLIPLLPTMKAKMNITLFQVGLIITAFSIPAGLVIPIAGYLSDRFSRKAIMAPALIIYGLGGLIAGFASLLLAKPYNVLLIGRIIQGIGAGGTYQLAMALIGDIFQSKERTKALGLLEAANGLGKVVSPVSGAALGLIIWFAPFFVYGFLAIPVAFAVWLIVKEPQENKKRQNPGKYLTKLKEIFKEKGVSLISSFLAGGVVLFILFGTLSYISDVLEQKYGIRGFSTGLLIAIPVASMALTSYLSGVYLSKQASHHLKIAIVLGLLGVTGAMAVIAFITNIYFLFIALIVMGIGTGIVLPAVNTLITSAAATEERGIITCLYGSTRFFGVAIGPPTFGLVTELGKTPLFLGAALLVIIITVIAFVFIKEKVLLPPGLLQGN